MRYTFAACCLIAILSVFGLYSFASAAEALRDQAGPLFPLPDFHKAMDLAKFWAGLISGVVLCIVLYLLFLHRS